MATPTVLVGVFFFLLMTALDPVTGFLPSTPAFSSLAFVQLFREERAAQTTPTSNHHCSWSNLSSCLSMGKGDGKKKRKKKAPGGDNSSNGNTPSPFVATTTTSSSSSTPPPQPQRVTSDSNVPVRHQLRWAKLNKEYRRAQASPGFRQQKVVRTRYRRSWDEEEIVMKAEERKRKGQDPDWDVILNRTAVRPLVIVDGYNIIHQWARLKKHMSRGDLSRARQLLVDDLEVLRSVKGWRIEVVFDGTRKSTVGVLGSGPGGSDRSTRMDQESKASVSKHGVRVVYSGVGREADAYIEARCAAAKNVTNGSMTGQFIVASSDAMIRLAGTNAGAWCMSADRFVSELKALKKVVEYRVEAAVARVNSQTVNNQAPVRFGRRSVLIEDKRNRTKTNKKPAEEEYEMELNLNVEADENGIPWWAQLPNASTRYN